MSAPWGAWLLVLGLALGGMVGCASPVAGPVELVADDRAVDALWLALARGDLAAADDLRARLVDPDLRQRARLDVIAAREGRPRALEEAWALGGWWPARFLASAEAARETLRASGGPGPVARLEDARRSASSGRRLAMARALLSARPGGAEALAVLVETHLDRGELRRAEAWLDDAPSTARLDAARRRLDLSVGRHAAVVRGLLADWEAGRITPTGLDWLQRLLPVLGREELQAAALERIRADALAGGAHEDARRRLAASLNVRAGRLAEGVEQLAGVTRLDPLEARAVERLEARLGGSPVEDSAAGRLERVRDRPEHVDLARLRWLHEWDLAARGAYAAVWAEDRTLELDDFLTLLDEAAAEIPGAPGLADLPRRDFGLFGTLLDTRSLAASWPDLFVLGGAGFLMPPEITVYDRLGRETVERGDELVADLPVRYTRHLVRDLQVPGYLASRGARFAGVGLVDLVFLDLDEVARQASFDELLGPEVAPRPAHDRSARRDLSEPLDVAARLLEAARLDAGEQWSARLQEVLDIHEGRHIIDVQRFLDAGLAGQLWEVLSAGLLPGSVRAEVEYRAQLDALRAARDPRIALAQAVAYLPVEGARLQSEHAVAYARLVAEVVAALDDGDWPGAASPAELGLTPDAVLVQQLHRVGPDVLRAIAAELWDG